MYVSQLTVFRLHLGKNSVCALSFGLLLTKQTPRCQSPDLPSRSGFPHTHLPSQPWVNHHTIFLIFFSFGDLSFPPLKVSKVLSAVPTNCNVQHPCKGGAVSARRWRNNVLKCSESTWRWKQSLEGNAGSKFTARGLAAGVFSTTLGQWFPNCEPCPPPPGNTEASPGS